MKIEDLDTKKCETKFRFGPGKILSQKKCMIYQL